MPFQARNAVFKKLSEITDIAALSKDEREKYDESLKVMRDYHATLEGAALLGRREGHEKGLAEGRAEGRAVGRAEGELSKSQEIARNLLGLGMPVPQIMQATGLTQKQIEQLEK